MVGWRVRDGGSVGWVELSVLGFILQPNLRNLNSR
jgi:hypothetical protein